LIAAIIAIHQAKAVNQFILYTDSEYVRNGLKKILENKRNQKSGNKNDDLWNIAEEIIKERKRKGQNTQIEHVNSHLLDENAEKTVKNYKQKWKNMKEKFGDDVFRILEGNREADRLASEMQDEELECLGMEVNDTAVKWTIANMKIFWNWFPDFIDWWKRRQRKKYKEKYKEERWTEKDYDVKTTKRIYSSLSYRNVLVQNWGFKMRYNKVKTKQAVSNNKMMKIKTPNIDKYQQLGCPLGCQFRGNAIEEDIEHIVCCSKTISLAKNIPKNILEIINRYTEKRIDFFPGFYWIWNQKRYINKNSELEAKLQAMILDWHGLVLFLKV
jgi:ribonuclease HI